MKTVDIERTFRYLPTFMERSDAIAMAWRQVQITRWTHNQPFSSESPVFSSDKRITFQSEQMKMNYSISL